MPGGGALQVREIDDPDRLDEIAPSTRFKVYPLLSAPFHVSVIVLKLGDMLLQVGHTSPFVGLAECTDGHATLQIPFGAVAGLILNGTAMRAAMVGTYGPGGELQRANPQANSFASITFTAAFAEILADENATGGLFRRGTARLIRVQEDARARAVTLVRKVALTAQLDPEALMSDPSRLALRRTLVAAARVLLAPPQDGTVRAPPFGRARTQILRAADAYIRATPGQPLYPDQVSHGIGVPVRDLESAFRANFGTSASGLLNRRRLDLVRAAIVSAEKSTVSIRAIAIEHGFWDLRGFERAYQASFGESSADTLINARGYKGVLKVVPGGRAAATG
jgi:AraC-like DNA-binding protein